MYHITVGLEGGYIPNAYYENIETLEDVKETIREFLDYDTIWVPITGLTSLRARDVKNSGFYGVCVGYLKPRYKQITEHALLEIVTVTYTHKPIEYYSDDWS